MNVDTSNANNATNSISNETISPTETGMYTPPELPATTVTSPPTATNDVNSGNITNDVEISDNAIYDTNLNFGATQANEEDNDSVDFANPPDFQLQTDVLNNEFHSNINTSDSISNSTAISNAVPLNSQHMTVELPNYQRHTPTNSPIPPLPISHSIPNNSSSVPTTPQNIPNEPKGKGQDSPSSAVSSEDLLEDAIASGSGQLDPHPTTDPSMSQTSMSSAAAKAVHINNDTAHTDTVSSNTQSWEEPSNTDKAFTILTRIDEKHKFLSKDKLSVDEYVSAAELKDLIAECDKDINLVHDLIPKLRGSVLSHEQNALQKLLTALRTAENNYDEVQKWWHSTTISEENAHKRARLPVQPAKLSSPRTDRTSSPSKIDREDSEHNTMTANSKSIKLVNGTSNTVNTVSEPPPPPQQPSNNNNTDIGIVKQQIKSIRSENSTNVAALQRNINNVCGSINTMYQHMDQLEQSTNSSNNMVVDELSKREQQVISLQSDLQQLKQSIHKNFEQLNATDKRKMEIQLNKISVSEQEAAMARSELQGKLDK